MVKLIIFLELTSLMCSPHSFHVIPLITTLLQILQDTPPVLLHITMVLPCPVIVIALRLCNSTIVVNGTELDVMLTQSLLCKWLST